ncbi:sugar ABC transporter ATP-binding protein [Acetobacter sp. DsW_059]|uniref:sugar ABC transporter ATP-binding protein n=1 Tax=Acetobacter sp. DsW_059 TaxID=1670661 RepID=UPI000A368D8D|nr:sugar ABC transporter ATP-binding protein [Acetobacter sp. DsW_059]OUJ09613.1 hypothetical protein HK25_11000 [Acetobacter sp. DsW_059]
MSYEGFDISIKDISKKYGSTIALENVNFNIKRGEVHALLGENGAGKSTIVNILSGSVQPDNGEITLYGKKYYAKGVVNARLNGISTAFQEFSLLPDLTVYENLMLPKLHRNLIGMHSSRLNIEKAEKLLSEFDLGHINVKKTVRDLSLADKQRVEIVRAISHAPKLLVLDEPTTALPDVDWLYKIIDILQSKGTSILYISHRLNEIRALAQRATIMRNGRSVATINISDASDDNIFEMMVGRYKGKNKKINQFKRENTNNECLNIKNISGKIISNINLKLNEGEIIGIAALDGQGQSEFFKILSGNSQPLSGDIFLDGSKVSFKSPRSALNSKRGISYVSDDRKNFGIFKSIKTMENISASSPKKISKRFILSDNNEKKYTNYFSDIINLSHRYLDFNIENLSGGNQQKALIARSLMSGAKILLLFDPTKGVDVGTKEDIYEAIRNFARNGGAVIFYSSDLEEIMSLSEICLVFYKGKISKKFKNEELKESHLVSYMTGNFIN